MLTIKNPVSLLLFAVVAISGCAPSGSRALLEGKRRLDAGKIEQALPKLKYAAEELGTNAVAWNDLGLAYHHSGRIEDATKAYLKALNFNRSLSEARYNLGCLHFEQGNLQEARSALTAYTIEQDKDPAGFLKLGAVSSRMGDLAGAERAFQSALRLSPEHPEALTGLGVIRQKKGRSVEAAELFSRALKSDPQFGSAILNYAIVARQSLKDRPLALRLFQQYLSLKPQPTNAAVVIVEASELQRELAAPVQPPGSSAVGGLPTVQTRTAPQNATNKPSQAPAASLINPVVHSPPKPQPGSGDAMVSQPSTSPALSAAAEAEQSKAKASGRSFFSRLFGSRPSEKSQTSLTNAQTNAVSSTIPIERPTPAKSYTYLNPPRPATGNRSRAERAFADGVTARQQRRISDAVKLYKQAAESDPSFFNAHYNLALIFVELGELDNGARSYERAIAARPDSIDARYNFALALKNMGYYRDSIRELEKLVVINPADSRAHIMLGNIYSQQMHQDMKAREHYTKALEADPRNPQAAVIRQWLSVPRN